MTAHSTGLTAMAMHYRIRAYWGATQVLDAQATAVMATDIASGFMRDNFAGSFARAEIERQLSHLLDRVSDGQSVHLDFTDSTGRAQVSIWRPLDIAEQVQPN